MMRDRWRAALRAGVIAAGAVVIATSLSAFRPADWPIYLVFLLLAGILVVPAVEVLPDTALPIPGLAVTIGFLYIAGPPIIVLRLLAPLLPTTFRRMLPRQWRDRVPALRAEAWVKRSEPFGQGLRWDQSAAGALAEWASFALGMATRLWVVSMLGASGFPVTNPGAIAIAEVIGYHVWGLTAFLPIYPDRPLFPLPSRGGMRTVLQDIGLIVFLALTPFVFLISYGFQTLGLAGAAAWSLSTLGLHFMLKRLSERRITVEEQNRRLETLNRELEHRERLSAIGKMSSVVSHQILHQLGVIGIYADLVRHAAADGDPAAGLEQVRSYGIAIEEALRDVNRVLTDLLVFSRDLRLNLYRHPLARVIEESVESTRAEAAERGVGIQVEPVPAVELTVDKLKIKQAIVNVLRNAIEVSPPGGAVVVRGLARDGHAEIRVSDRGCGVPPQDRDAVFTPFFTTKEHGTGLGLAIAREFTAAHGGRLWVESDDGGGACFVFQLPRAEPGAVDRREHQSGLTPGPFASADEPCDEEGSGRR